MSEQKKPRVLGMPKTTWTTGEEGNHLWPVSSMVRGEETNSFQPSGYSSSDYGSESMNVPEDSGTHPITQDRLRSSATTLELAEEGNPVWNPIIVDHAKATAGRKSGTKPPRCGSLPPSVDDGGIGVFEKPYTEDNQNRSRFYSYRLHQGSDE